jgi:hypothetical protein
LELFSFRSLKKLTVSFEKPLKVFSSITVHLYYFMPPAGSRLLHPIARPKCFLLTTSISNNRV